MIKEVAFDNPKLSKPSSNYFLIPNDFFQITKDITSCDEIKVILYAFQHTWGHKCYEIKYNEYGDVVSKNRSTLTVGEFLNGKQDAEGNRLDEGVMLKAEQIIDAVDLAVEHGFFNQYTEVVGDVVRKYYSIVIDETVKQVLKPLVA